MIQTYLPSHYALKFAAFDKLEEFWKEETFKRRQLHYPPSGQLTKLIFQHNDQRIAKREAEKLYATLTAHVPHGVSITPPQPPFIPKIRGAYRYQMVIKKTPLRNHDQKYESELQSILRALPPAWLIDVDPISLL